MGDAPLAHVEGAGGVRVAEDEIVAVGKNDVGPPKFSTTLQLKNICRYCRSKWEGNGDSLMGSYG